MAGLDKEDNKHSLFKDEKELTVAVKYMIENGECLTVTRYVIEPARIIQIL